MTSRRRSRGTTTERGYGADWQRLVATWAQTIAAHGALCTNPVCVMPSRLIPAGSPRRAWDGGHDDQRNPRGPEHRRCNRAAAARRRNQLFRTRRVRPSLDTSRRW